MPLPAAVLAGVIAGGSQLLGTGINAISQGSMNKKSRQWNEKMYGIQRQDALADWAMQNQYNHPSSQMARLREAGLNPNLVYGTGAVGNTSTNVRGTEAKAWNPQAPQIDLGGSVSSGLGAYYDVKVKEAQVDNLRVQNTVLKNDALLKAANTLKSYIDSMKGQADTDLKKFELKKQTSLFETTIAQALTNLEKTKVDIEKTKADTQFTIDENTRKAMLFQPTFEKAVEEVFTQRAKTELTKQQAAVARQNIELMKKTGVLRDIEIGWAKKGVSSRDGFLYRAGANLIDAIFGGKPLTEAEFNEFKKHWRGWNTIDSLKWNP